MLFSGVSHTFQVYSSMRIDLRYCIRFSIYYYNHNLTVIMIIIIIVGIINVTYGSYSVFSTQLSAV